MLFFVNFISCSSICRQKVIAAKSRNQNNDAVILEGVRLIKDALKLGAEAECLYFCDPKIVETLPIEYLKEINLFKILYRDMKTWSDTSTPPGILGLLNIFTINLLFSILFIFIKLIYNWMSLIN